MNEIAERRNAATSGGERHDEEYRVGQEHRVGARRGDGPPRVAIACQGGGSHAAFTAGVLQGLFDPRHDGAFELIGLSGTSGGAMCAAIAWAALVGDGTDARESGGRHPRRIAAARLEGFWQDLISRQIGGIVVNEWAKMIARLPLTFEFNPFAARLKSDLAHLAGRYIPFDRLDRTARCGIKLLIGATDIERGLGVAFCGAELTLDDLLASAAVPPLFDPVETRGGLFWDGLLSRNPPIREFLQGERVENKPEEIWVIQINPRIARRRLVTIVDKIDRRNELAGNIALIHELRLIARINDLLRENPPMGRSYRPVKIKVVELDLDLDYASKLDRSRRHIEMLLARGRAAAEAFLGDASLWTPVPDPPCCAGGHGETPTGGHAEPSRRDDRR